RIGGNLADMYVNLSLLGDPTHLNLIWLTDQMNPTRDQAPNSDRPDDGLFIPIVTTGSITIVKDAEPNSAQAFGFTGDLGNFDLADDGGGNSTTFTDLAPGPYDVAETVPADWTLGSIVCGDPAAGRTIGIRM